LLYYYYLLNTFYLVPDLPAIPVQLTIERPVIGFGQMAVILFAHIPFLLVNAAKVTPVLTGLWSAQVTVLTLVGNSPFLVVGTAVYLVHPWMAGYMGTLVTGTLRECRRC
jgi:hypothetical protein